MRPAGPAAWQRSAEDKGTGGWVGTRADRGLEAGQQDQGLWGADQENPLTLDWKDTREEECGENEGRRKRKRRRAETETTKQKGEMRKKTMGMGGGEEGGLRGNGNRSCGGGREPSNDLNTGKLLSRGKQTNNYKEIKGHS